MRDPLVQKVKAFLSSHWQPGSPFLLGYSGGPDSKALLYILLECRKALPFELCLAHVDHGWREESREEAEAIAREADQLGLQLFVRRLDTLPDRNIEAEGRKERTCFFQKVYREIHAQGLLLAHQADDQAETVLKRLLEGAHLSHWSGIGPIGEIEGMRVLRPLLIAEKKELVEWLGKKGLSAFEDATNLSLRFLRGRMRSEIIPELARQFGKKISLNLCKAGAVSSEIDAYFMRQCESHWAKLVSSEEGIDWDLSEVKEPLELKWLLKSWFDRERLNISYEVILRIVEGLLNRQVARQFPIKEGILYLKRGHLIYIPKQLQKLVFNGVVSH